MALLLPQTSKSMDQILATNAVMQDAPKSRLRLTLGGAVQGMGFRPFVYRLANELGLAGWVSNSAQGVDVEVEGDRRRLEEFLLRVGRDKPPQSDIRTLDFAFLDTAGFSSFEIRQSHAAGAKSALILPDMATCAACLQEVFDPANRRHLYPFTNCTHCGPRFSIVESIPYDRARTTMKRFVMCARCRAEYENPLDRRFHAQPNACPQCGPQLELWDNRGGVLAGGHAALLGAAERIARGQIVAVKGLGGFHLMADARNSDAVRLLRARKHREQKPLALMVPSLETARGLCELSAVETELLRSPAAPIVLLRRSPASHVSPEVAPLNPYLGIMLPYTPLHHLLLRAIGHPVVATSGNVSDEPICIDEQEAVCRLGGIADFFLVHDRPIARQLDDSVVRMTCGEETVFRRSRGYAPLQFSFGRELPDLIALGGHLKNTVALAKGSEIFLSQHIGDLDSAQARAAFEREIDSLARLHERSAAIIVCDLHPDYGSTLSARRRGKKLIAVQHHHAHVFSCMAENEIDAPLLGVAWDGSGLGEDGTIWGGEFFYMGDTAPARVAHIRPFPLAGGERAVKEPRRAALGLLYEIYGAAAFETSGLLPRCVFPDSEMEVLRTMLGRRFRAPLASSVGRLFDAVACLLDLAVTTSFEGQAAMALEFACDGIYNEESYPFPLSGQGPSRPMLLDWEEMIRSVIKDRDCGVPVGTIAARFHNALIEAILAVAVRVNEEKVALSGGCFQNRYLTEHAVARLKQAGFRPYSHRRVPPNDGGLALGQLAAAARAIARE
jgi:hydrogenase maturation protein HypF